MWHNKRSVEILNELDTYVSDGLTTEEAGKRLEKYGKNEFSEKKKDSLIKRFFDQFKDFLIILLIIAAGIELYAKAYTEAIVILAIVILNAILSIYQEGQAEKSLEALKEMSAPEAKVIRNGKRKVVPASELVPGDIIIIETGDIIPADLRLITSQNLKIDESSLTGESVAVEKNADEVLSEDVSLGDRINIAYMSSIVTYGRGCGVVVGTGHNTEIGKIATLIDDIEDELTPLQKELDGLGKTLGFLTIGICVLIFILGILQKREFLDMALTAVSLAVAAIPEGLPAIVTIVLSIGMKRMVKKNAIVKKLLAVETLGSTTVICSDKTGTLTQNEMTVTKIYTNGKFFDISGTGYEPDEKITYDNEQVSRDDFSFIKSIVYAACLNNDSELVEENGVYNITGDPTEGALVTLAGKAGFTKSELESLQPRIDELPFDSERKMMSTFHSLDDRIIQYIKGAPDNVIARCNYIYSEKGIRDITQDDIENVKKANLSLAQGALRVLGYAFKFYNKDEELIKTEDNMIFIGLTGMIDPPREEAKDAIALCKKAGIKTKMITGDYRETAFQIAKELGIAKDHDETISGSELEKISDEDYKELVRHVNVYSRVSPEQKVKIIKALKENDETVAMTGDGVNDALAIKQADIGISMGITGTDVAKNTADIVLTDDNFASIVSAVEEGRIIFSNIQKFVTFLLSCNIGEILLVLFSMILGMPEPLKPIHLLWLNLITDSLPALALGVEPGEPGIMNQMPRKKTDPILNRSMFLSVFIQALGIAVANILSFKFALELYPESITHARSIVFTTLILSELLRALSNRSIDRNLWEIGLFTNKKMLGALLISGLLLIFVLYVPIAHILFDTFSLGFKDWEIVLMFSFIPLVVGEGWKLFNKYMLRNFK